MKQTGTRTRAKENFGIFKTPTILLFKSSVCFSCEALKQPATNEVIWMIYKPIQNNKHEIWDSNVYNLALTGKGYFS